MSTAPLIIFGLAIVGGVGFAVYTEVSYRRERRRGARVALDPRTDHPHGGYDPKARANLADYPADTADIDRDMGRFNCRGDYVMGDGQKVPAEAMGIEPAYGALTDPLKAMITNPKIVIEPKPEAARRITAHQPVFSAPYVPPIPVIPCKAPHPAEVHLVGRCSGPYPWRVYDCDTLVNHYTRKYTALLGAQRYRARKTKG